MRFSAWSSLATSVCSALLVAAPAAAHVDATPAFVPANGTDFVFLTAHNDRDEEMTGFSVTAPERVELDGSDAGDWRAEGGARMATWTGGRVAPNTDATFRVFLRVPPEPGTIELTAMQLYPGGEEVTWPVRLTITPAGTPSSSRSTVAALLTAGMLVAGALLFLARRRGEG